MAGGQDATPCRPGRRSGPGACLDGKDAHAARPGVDQHAVALLEARQV